MVFGFFRVLGLRVLYQDSGGLSDYQAYSKGYYDRRLVVIMLAVGPGSGLYCFRA